METIPKSPEAAATTTLETAATVATALPTTELPAAVMAEGGSTNGGAEGTSGEQKRELPEAPQPVAKRGRGRPKGTGKLQIHASYGGLFAATAGGNFTPYILIVHEGEDVTNTILRFNEQFSMSTCVLSATGSVCSVDLSVLGTPNSLRYEGKFDIVYLSASHTLGCNGEIITLLSISLADPHGRIFGGKVTGPMIAYEPVQIIMGVFVQEMKKKQRVGGESSGLQPILENDEENGEEPENENKISEETDGQPDNEENPTMPYKSCPLVDEVRVPSSNGDGDGDGDGNGNSGHTKNNGDGDGNGNSGHTENNGDGNGNSGHTEIDQDSAHLIG